MEKIILPTSTLYHLVPIKDIVFCKSNNSTTSFYLKDDKEITVSISIKEYEKQLSKCGFFRSHQSYLVNIDYIRIIDKSNAFKLILTNGINIPVSTRKRKELLQIINDSLNMENCC